MINVLNIASPLVCSIIQEDEKVDEHTYKSIRSEVGLGLVKRTRLGQLCISGVGVKSGSEVTKNGSGGTSVMSFAIKSDVHTPPHIDTETVKDEVTDAVACALMMPVERSWDNVSSKRAVIVSRHDKSNVVRLLGLDLAQVPIAQYKSSDIRVLADLTKILDDGDVGYVVVDFPARCSYVIPDGCMHMFCTMGLTETTSWFPSIQVASDVNSRKG